METIRHAVEQKQLAQRTHVNTEVRSLRQAKGEEQWQVDAQQPAVHASYLLRASVVVMCTNLRLGKPRMLHYAGEGTFRGQVAHGTGFDSDGLQLQGQRVVALGMGAFAVEVMRTSLERKCAHAALLCRQRGAVSLSAMDWLRFVRPYDPVTLATDRAGDAIIFHKWTRTYDTSGAARPECWLHGLMKPDGHTLSVSDIFFVAHYLKLLDTHLGQVKSLISDPETGIVCDNGTTLFAGTLFKCIGFEKNEGSERLLARTQIDFSGESRMWMLQEPYLDSGVFNSRLVTLGHMRVSSFVGTLVLRQFKGLQNSAAGPAPRYRISHMTASDVAVGLNSSADAEVSVRQAMLDALRVAADDFGETMTPEQYVVHNSTLWDQLHEELLPLRNDAGISTLLVQQMPYPFTNVLQELPDMSRLLTSTHIPSVQQGTLHPLLDVETSLLGMTNPSVETLTFFRGAPPVDLLKQRLALIARANPWLAGRLRSTEDDAPHLWVPASADAAVSFREVFPASEHAVAGLTPDTPVMVLMEKCAGIGVKTGLNCLDEDEPIFKVVVLHTSSQGFALLVSMSHVIGDAATFYKVYDMLGAASSVVSLDFSRITSSMNTRALSDTFGTQAREAHQAVLNTTHEGIKQLRKNLEASEKARRKEATVHLIDTEQIRRQKELHSHMLESGEQVSTNDILTVWYMRKVGASHATVACNCRGRLQGVPSAEVDFKPGNYLTALFCSPEDLQSPLTFRRKVNTLNTVSSKVPDVPAGDASAGNHVFKSIGNSTNWSKFGSELELRGCTQEVHLPILDSLHDMTHANLYVFSARPGVLGALSFAAKGALDGSNDDSLLLPWRTVMMNESTASKLAHKSAGPAQRSSSKRAHKAARHAQRPSPVLDDERLLRMREGDEGEPLLVLVPSNFGTVLDKSRLAHAVPAEVWGLQHGSIATGDPSYLLVRTLEEAANEYAELLLQAMQQKAIKKAHFFGSSFDAMMAHKVATALRARGGVTGFVFLVDPPPPGPCRLEGMELTQNPNVAAALATRAARVAAGHVVTDMQTIYTDMYAACEDCSEAATVLALELARLGLAGQEQAADDSMRNQRRRLRVLQHHMRLWHAQQAQPEPYPYGLIIITTVLHSRQEFYGSGTDAMCERDACHADLLQQYGPHSLALEVDCGHVELNQAILAHRQADVARLLCDELCKHTSAYES